MFPRRFKTTPINPRYGVQIHDIQLADITVDSGYAEIREAFETYSLLFFADQQIDDEAHLRLGALFGPREDRTIHVESSH